MSSSINHFHVLIKIYNGERKSGERPRGERFCAHPLGSPEHVFVMHRKLQEDFSAGGGGTVVLP